MKLKTFLCVLLVLTLVIAFGPCFFPRYLFWVGLLVGLTIGLISMIYVTSQPDQERTQAELSRQEELRQGYLKRIQKLEDRNIELKKQNIILCSAKSISQLRRLTAYMNKEDK